MRVDVVIGRSAVKVGLAELPVLARGDPVVAGGLHQRGRKGSRVESLQHGLAILLQGDAPVGQGLIGRNHVIVDEIYGSILERLFTLVGKRVIAVAVAARCGPERQDECRGCINGIFEQIFHILIMIWLTSEKAGIGDPQRKGGLVVETPRAGLPGGGVGVVGNS